MNEAKNQPHVFYSNSVARPAPNTTVTAPIVPPLLHRRCALFSTAIAACAVRPAPTLGTDPLLVFLNNWVGNIFGVADT